MLDPSCQKLLRLLAMGGSPPRPDDIGARRENFRKLLDVAGGVAPATVVTRDDAVETAAGALLYRSYRRRDAAAAELATCVFLHGGGFVAGSIDTHDRICRVLAEASGWQILSVDYRLAPEDTFPAQIEDGMAMLSAVAAEPRRFGADPAALAVAGDSVGAGLAAHLARKWRDEGHDALALQVLLCPALEAEPRHPSRQEFARGYYIEDQMIAADFSAYRGARTDVPSVSADLGGLPPAIIHVADCDPFRDEGLAYAEALARAGVRVETTRHPGMLHLFHAFGKFIPAGPAALRAAGAQMRAHVDAAAR